MSCCAVTIVLPVGNVKKFSDINIPQVQEHIEYDLASDSHQ